MRLIWSLVVLLGLMCVPSKAHELPPAYLQIWQSGTDIFDVLWKVPALGAQLRLALEVNLPTDIVPITEPRSTFVNNAFITRWQVRDPGLVTGKTIAISGLDSTLTDALVRTEWSGGGIQVQRLTPSHPSFLLEAPEGALTVATTYIGMGIEHILTG